MIYSGGDGDFDKKMAPTDAIKKMASVDCARNGRQGQKLILNVQLSIQAMENYSLNNVTGRNFIATKNFSHL